jgi:hypothetical protein
VRNALCCLIVLMVAVTPLCAESPQPAAPPSGADPVVQVQTLEPAIAPLFLVESTTPDVAAAAQVQCSGSCGGGRTWTWTCPAGYDCFLNCTKNPPTYCWKATISATLMGEDIASSQAAETVN